MATFEEAGICDQVLANSYNLVRNMRDNAVNYKARITAGQSAASVAAVMVADANEYLRRLAWATDLASRNLTLFTSALATRDLTVASANTLKNSLISVANHTIAASLTTGAQINAEADFILANTPNFERMW